MRQEYDFDKGKRGPVVKSPPDKVRITIRLDEDVIDWFKDQVNEAGGGHYQTLINRALRDYMVQSKEPMEDTVRGGTPDGPVQSRFISIA
jgi:uncharacterized protein (DUF4415 family)